LAQLHADVRQRFPQISAAADHEHLRLWDELSADELGHFSWFGSLANAVNAEMSREVDPTLHLPLLLFLEGSLDRSEDVHRCLDVSFAENLFWGVQVVKREPWWRALPPRLRELYLDFHPRPPIP
jgi:hypothetical protein